MVGLSESLVSAISNASTPELKDVLRKISSISRGTKETIGQLEGSLTTDERNSCSSLGKIVSKICEQREEVRSIVIDTLADEEEEMSSIKQLLEESEEAGYESNRSSSAEIQSSRKRKWKWKLNTVPRSEPKRTKMTQAITVDGATRSIAIPRTAMGDINFNYLKLENTQQQSPPSMSQNTKKTVDDIFEADAARRVREEAEELARIKEIQDTWTVDSDSGLATCARCKKFFEKGQNTEESCVFHPGVRRHYHNQSRWGDSYFCCGQAGWHDGCRASKHIDEKTPGIRNNLARLRRIAERHSAKRLYRCCATCSEDVEVSQDGDKLDDRGPRDDGRVLCDDCEKEEEIFDTECHHCYNEMRVHPDDWGVGEEILCEACQAFPAHMESDDGLEHW